MIHHPSAVTVSGGTTGIAEHDHEALCSPRGTEWVEPGQGATCTNHEERPHPVCRGCIADCDPESFVRIKDGAPLTADDARRIGEAK